MELFLSSIFTCVSFLVVSTAGVNVNVTTVGCTVFIQWNKETHSEVYIDIRNAKDKDHLGIETSRGRFTYADVQPGQSYNITWTPIRIINNTRVREWTLKEENYVLIPRDCNIQTSSSEISTPKTGTKRRKQNDPQSARSAGVNVKSTFYSNNTPHYYDEVQYSLAQEIER
nr:uncharacterized protein LOC105328712 isoform X2 [Crassostrea gigas]